MQTRDRSAETFHQFWSVDRGIFDTARELAHAHTHTSATEGAEHAEHAEHASTLTAAHTRDRQQLPRYSATRPATYEHPVISERPGRTTGSAVPAAYPTNPGGQAPMPPPKRSCTRRPPSGRPHPGPTARRLTAAPRSNVSSGHQSLEPPDVLQELEILDEIAKRVSGDMVNAGIASIDTLWTAGQDLAPLQNYRGLALRASPQYTAALWTLIAWIHWRTGNRREAWPALHLAKQHLNHLGPVSGHHQRIA